MSSIESISALTLATRDMARAVAFYQALGLSVVHGGPTSPFTSLRAGSGFVNLTSESSAQSADVARRDRQWWGRAVFYVSDVDAMYRRAIDAGFGVDTTPRDAEWGERYFHITDTDGHELSFARPLAKS